MELICCIIVFIAFNCYFIFLRYGLLYELACQVLRHIKEVSSSRKSTSINKEVILEALCARIVNETHIDRRVSP